MDCRQAHKGAAEHLVCLCDVDGRVVTVRLCAACIANALLHGALIEEDEG